MKHKNLSTTKMFSIVLLFLSVLAGGLLIGGSDLAMVMEWWLVSIVLSIGTYPLAARLTGFLADGGYFMAKILSILLAGWATWLICYMGVPFNTPVSWLVFLVISAICWAASAALGKKPLAASVKESVSEILGNDMIWLEEALYLFLFIFWLYRIGFRPEAFGTERLMDYGFMATMLRGKSVPATDMWYSEGILNYYYGGQYYVVYIINLCHTALKYAYNLYRAMLPALAFVMAFDMVATLFQRTYTGKKTGLKYAAGALGGAALTFAANGHFILFYKIIPMIQELLGIEVNTYWFSDSTRYIGFVPDVEDKTIHEFPAYSFLLGDLHAHVINIMFVLLFLTVLMNWSFRQGALPGTKRMKADKNALLANVLQPEILMLSFLVGIFKWTNFWDFAIYFGLAGLILLAMNIRSFRGQPWTITIITALEAAVALVISTIVILPFTLDFDTMFQGIGFCINHSRFYQLVILWGIPVVTVLLFTVFSYLKEAEQFGNEVKKEKFSWLHLNPVTLFVIIMGLYAILMLIVPEVVFVRDIYGEGNQRSNTMFKFTYQAFMMFAIVMSYALMRMITEAKKHTITRKAVLTLTFLLLWTICYLPAGTRLWFGDITKPSNYRGSDATRYMETEVPFDESAIHWLDENVKESVVCLEADGTSYTKNNIVSGVTGLPTVVGWYVHEWLWRNDTDDLNQKTGEIREIYTSDDVNRVKELIEKYHVAYIFAGTNEYEKYDNNINHAVLSQLADVVFTADTAPEEHQATCVYKVR
ncbi:MAG: hypothetical protein KBT01_01295 [Clostridiales bacterium]|nr:hypothetical protein [Candidatus Blautia equi]